MKIVAANQYLSSSEQHIVHKSRLEIFRSDNPRSDNSRSDNTPRITPVVPNVPRPTPANPLGQASAAPPPATTTAASSESTSSEEQNEDSQQFNAQLTIGAVKRILEQLTSGKLLSWIQGSDLEKIQAQKAQQVAGETAAEQTSVSPDNAATTNTNGSTVFEMSYRFQQVSANFTGAVELADGSAVSWSFDLKMQSEQFSMSMTQTPPLKDPLVLSFDQTPFRYTGETHAFDFFANGETKQLAGLASSQYYLTYDLNQNNKIDNGSELFGPTTNQGYQELAQLDDDKNGFIDENDSSWSKLGVWQPGASLNTLSQMGVAAISTMSVATSFGLYNGEKLQAQIARSGIFLKENGTVGLMQQVDLNV